MTKANEVKVPEDVQEAVVHRLRDPADPIRRLLRNEAANLIESLSAQLEAQKAASSIFENQAKHWHERAEQAEQRTAELEKQLGAKNAE